VNPSARGGQDVVVQGPADPGADRLRLHEEQPQLACGRGALQRGDADDPVHIFRDDDPASRDLVRLDAELLAARFQELLVVAPVRLRAQDERAQQGSLLGQGRPDLHALAHCYFTFSTSARSNLTGRSSCS
jgi:hypothetical protein